MFDADLCVLGNVVLPDRVVPSAAVVTQGEHLFGPTDGGEPCVRADGVGVMPDGKALASSVQGMDHMVRTFLALTGRQTWEAVRIVILTPATIIRLDAQIGSLRVGKLADLLVQGPQINVSHVVIAGRLLDISSPAVVAH